jgi:hypothetical protein
VGRVFESLLVGVICGFLDEKINKDNYKNRLYLVCAEWLLKNQFQPNLQGQCGDTYDIINSAQFCIDQ